MNKVRYDLRADVVHKKGIVGRNIAVAVLDTGIFPHNDFCKPYYRIGGFVDFVNGYNKPYDDNGHGTHVCGIIGGNGYSMYEKYRGMAPECIIIAEKILDKYGVGDVASVVEALKWTIKYKELYNIRIVNLSVGTYGIDKDDVKLLIKWVEKAWDSGLIVLTAAGNKGPRPMSITAPGISKKIITVGTCERNIFINDNKKNHYHSGCGPTRECIVKPEVVAPGVNITSCSNQKNEYTSKSGTSMATPIVAGALALVLEWAERYGRVRISNKDIKIGLLETSKDLGRDKNEQGWGKVDLLKLLTYFDRV